MISLNKKGDGNKNAIHKKEYYKERKAVLTIQKIWRGYSTRKTMSFNLTRKKNNFINNTICQTFIKDKSLELN